MNRTRLTLALALIATFTAGTALAGSVTPFKLLRLEHQVAKWYPAKAGEAVVIRYAFSSQERSFKQARNCRKIQPVEAALRPSRISMDTFRRQTRDAMRMWESIVAIRFIETDDETNADLVIGAQVASRGRAFTNVKLESKPGPDGIKSIERSLICLNPRVMWKDGFDGDLEVYDLTYTMAHELGHAIGLDHPGPHGQLMSFKYHEQFAGLQVGDIDGALKLYNPAPGALARRAFAVASARTRSQARAAASPERESRFGLGARDR